MSAACSTREELPTDILSPKEMSLILIDIHLLEQQIENSVYTLDSQRTAFNHFEQLVFEKHQVDTAIYARSLNYYMSEPKLLEDIYEIVVDSLTVREKTKNLN